MPNRSAWVRMVISPSRCWQSTEGSNPRWRIMTTSLSITRTPRSDTVLADLGLAKRDCPSMVTVALSGDSTFRRRVR
jgi:hypothetical protein